MSEERRKILEMLSKGQITVEEAERLMAALGKEPANGAAAGSSSGAKPKPKYLRVVVSDEDDRGAPSKANIRVPLDLLRAGVKLTSIIPPQAWERVNVALNKEGVKIDLNQLKPEHLENVIDQLDDVTVDVDDHKTKVRVFFE